MKEYVSKWLHGLFSALISGIATSGLSALSIMGASEAGVDVAKLDLKQAGIIALVGGVIGAFLYLKQSPLPRRVWTGSVGIALAVATVAATGCARFSTVQKDVRVYPDGSTTTITTKAKANTFFEADSRLTEWEATQTEDEQGAKVGALQQTATGTATNIAEWLEALGDAGSKIAEGAAKGAVKGAVPTP